MIVDYIIAGVPCAATTITLLLTCMVASLDAVRWFLEEFENRSAKKKKKKKKKASNYQRKAKYTRHELSLDITQQ